MSPAVGLPGATGGVGSGAAVCNHRLYGTGRGDAPHRALDRQITQRRCAERTLPRPTRRSRGDCRFREEEQFHVRNGGLGSQGHGPCSGTRSADGIDRQTIDGELQEFETFGEFQRAIDRAGRFHVEEGRAQAAAVDLPGVAHVGLDDARPASSRPAVVLGERSRTACHGSPTTSYFTASSAAGCLSIESPQILQVQATGR